METLSIFRQDQGRAGRRADWSAGCRAPACAGYGDDGIDGGGAHPSGRRSPWCRARGSTRNLDFRRGQGMGRRWTVDGRKAWPLEPRRTCWSRALHRRRSRTAPGVQARRDAAADVGQHGLLQLFAVSSRWRSRTLSAAFISASRPVWARSSAVRSRTRSSTSLWRSSASSALRPDLGHGAQCSPECSRQRLERAGSAPPPSRRGRLRMHSDTGPKKREPIGHRARPLAQKPGKSGCTVPFSRRPRPRLTAPSFQ